MKIIIHDMPEKWQIGALQAVQEVAHLYPNNQLVAVQRPIGRGESALFLVNKNKSSVAVRKCD